MEYKNISILLVHLKMATGPSISVCYSTEQPVQFCLISSKGYS